MHKQRCALHNLSLAFRCALITSLVSLGASHAVAVEVTALSEGTEQRFAFAGGAFPYVLRLWEGRIGAGTYRGLGLRGPWWKDAGISNAWYMNQFLDVLINGKRLLGDPDAVKQYPSLFERCEVLESGERALVQYLWERDAGSVRLRFLMRPDCRALLCELLVEPKQPIHSLSVELTAFPGAYTSKNDGDRRMKTAIREEKSPAKFAVDLHRETWMLFCDHKLDMADPINRRVGFNNNGCAGLHVLPDACASVNVELTGYPISISVRAKEGAYRMRLAFEELPLPNAEAYRVMQESDPVVQRVLMEESFQPSVLTRFDAFSEQAQSAGLCGHARITRDLCRSLRSALSEAERTVAVLRSGGDRPVSDEQSALTALSAYNRVLLTAKRYSDPKIYVFELRGPGYSRYQFSQAVATLGAAGGDISGGYLFISGQGRTINPFPGTMALLYHYDAVLLVDVDMRALAPQQLHLLKEYVEDGGALAVFGGFYSYGASNLKDSPLADVLPLQVKRHPFDLRYAGETPLTVIKPTVFLRGIRWPSNLISPWCHDLRLAEGAQLLVRQGNAPWLAVREVGRGRTVACAGTLMGETKSSRVLFFESPSWPTITARMLRWLARK